MFFNFESSVLGLNDKRESPNLFPNSGSTVEGEVNTIGVVRIFNSLVKVDIAIIVGEALGLLGPGEVIDTLVISIAIMEINSDGSIVSGVLRGS